jgi:hypothetical protein
MNDWRPSINVPVRFERTDQLGLHVIYLTLFSDGGVYLEGDEELAFDQGEDTLRTALAYIHQKGFEKKDLSV